MNDEGTSSEVEKQDEGLGPPQFRLITLLVAFTLLSIIFACYQVLGGPAAFGLALLVAAVAAHMIGNSLGTRLRDLDAAANQPTAVATKQRGQVTQDDLAPVTNLHESQSLRMPVLVCTAGGGVIGLLAGLFFFVWMMWEKATVWGSGMGVGAFVFLGGFFGFLVSGFFTVGMDALTQAQEEDAP